MTFETGYALLGTLLTLVVPAVVGSIAFVVAGSDEIDSLPLWAIALLQVPLWAGLLGAPLWASYRKGRRSLAADFGLAMRWTDVPLGLLAGFVGQFALGIIVFVLYDALGIDTDKVGDAAEEIIGAATDPIGVVLLVLVVVVAAPVLEELFHRGLWLRSLERRIGAWPAVVVSGLIFGALHFQPYDLLALAGFGILLGSLTVLTGRLGPAIWAHVAFNLTAVVTLLND